MKFINSASKAFDAVCDGIDAIASSTQLLANKIDKEISIQEQTMKEDIKYEVQLHRMEITRNLSKEIRKHRKFHDKNPWAYEQAQRVLNGESIDWASSNKDELTSIS